MLFAMKLKSIVYILEVIGYYYNLKKELQRKDPIAEVIAEAFSVTRLGKNVKRTSATTYVNGSGCFHRGSYRYIL